jgi:16S rRNA (adenine1518-N6/adenine1519-N6)-dimethyltransferase
MRKKLGQNFLINRRIREKLLDALEMEKGQEIWEVGPGLGAMTKGLLDRGGVLTAFEIDSAFAALLRELFGEYKNFTLIEGDILKTWQKETGALSDFPFFFGNLPYNIAAALIAKFIENEINFPRMVVTVQNEVALRMAAKAGSKEYSSFSVLCASTYKVTPLMLIKGSSFYPPPNVDSRGVRLDILPDEERPSKSGLFFPLVRSLFSSRRKTIKNNLINFAASVIVNEKAEKNALAALEKCGLSGTRRAETLGLSEFAALAETLEKMANDEF